MKRLLYWLGMYPLRLYWFIARPHAYGVKCVLRRSDGAILLVRHTYGTGAWTLPGGGMEQGESKEAAAQRELQEELGLDTPLREIGAFTNTDHYLQDHVTIFYGETDATVSIQDPHEIAEIGWFDPRALPEDTGNLAREALTLLP